MKICLWVNFHPRKPFLEGNSEKLEKTVRDILSMRVLGGGSPLEPVLAWLEGWNRKRGKKFTVWLVRKAHLLIVETPIAAGKRWPSIFATSILESCNSGNFQKTTCFEASEPNGSFSNYELSFSYYNG